MKVILLLFLTTFGITHAIRLQAVRVRGQLRCGDAPGTGVEVKLWDEDDG